MLDATGADAAAWCHAAANAAANGYATGNEHAATDCDVGRPRRQHAATDCAHGRPRRCDGAVMVARDHDDVFPSPTPSPAPDAVAATSTPKPTPEPTSEATATNEGGGHGGTEETGGGDGAFAPDGSCLVSELPSAIVNGPIGPEGPDRDSVFQSLAVYPTNPDIVLLGTERNGFMLTTDGGATWSRQREGMRVGSGFDSYAEVWDIDFAASDPSVVYSAVLNSPGPPGGTGPSADAGIYISSDGGRTWSLSTCGFPTSRTTSVRADPTNPDIAIAGLEGGYPSYTDATEYFPGGIFRTIDRGETWAQMDVGPTTRPTATAS